MQIISRDSPLRIVRAGDTAGGKNSSQLPKNSPRSIIFLSFRGKQQKPGNAKLYLEARLFCNMLSFFNNSLHHPTASHPRDGPTKLLLSAARIHGMVVGSSSYVRASGTPPKRGEGKAAPLPPIGQAGRRGRPMRERKEGENGHAREEKEKEGDFLSFMHQSRPRPPSPPKTPKTKMLF